MASAALEAGQSETAIEQYRVLLTKDPKSGNLHYLLAEACRSKGDKAAAIDAARKAMELDDPRAARFLGVMLDSVGRTLEAIPVYRRALQSQPEDLVALNNLAFALTETDGNLDEALKLVKLAQKLMADSHVVEDTLAWIYVKKNMTDSAIHIFKNLVRKKPDISTYRYHLAVALVMKGERAAAKTELQMALKKSPPKEEEQKIRELLGKTM